MTAPALALDEQPKRCAPEMFRPKTLRFNVRLRWRWDPELETDAEFERRVWLALAGKPAEERTAFIATRMQRYLAATNRAFEKFVARTVAEREQTRRLDCPSYERCLSWVAAKAQNWEGFTCAACPQFRATVVTPTQPKAEA